MPFGFTQDTQDPSNLGGGLGQTGTTDPMNQYVGQQAPEWAQNWIANNPGYKWDPTQGSIIWGGTGSPTVANPITNATDPKNPFTSVLGASTAPSWTTDPQFAKMDPALQKIYIDAGLTPGGAGSGFADWQYWQNAGSSQYNRLAADIAGTGSDNPQGTPWAPGAWQKSGGGGAGGTGTTGPAPGTTLTPFNWPTFNAPQPVAQQPLQAPAPFSFPDFSYQSFQAPTLEEAQNNPGYQFALQQGLQAMQQSAAAKGVLRTGGSLKDLNNYANAAATQNYQNVFNNDLTGYQTNLTNAFNTYNTNRNNAANIYATNYGVSKDVNASTNAANQQNYSNAFQNAAAAFNPQFQASQLQFSDLYNRWRDALNANTSLAGFGLS